MISASRECRFQEFFGAATSCNVQPISRIVLENEVIELTDRKVGSYLNNKIASIMSGPADHKWITSFE
jgi:hypothetical protein